MHGATDLVLLLAAEQALAPVAGAVDRPAGLCAVWGGVAGCFVFLIGVFDKRTYNNVCSEPLRHINKNGLHLS